MDGFIMFPRRIAGSPIMQKPILLQCFIMILFRTRFKEGTIFFNGHSVDLKIGQCVFSRNEFADALHLSPSRTYRAVKKLEELGEIELQSSSQYSIITVRNFGEYQPAAIRQPTEQQNDRKMSNALHHETLGNMGQTCEVHLSTEQQSDRKSDSFTSNKKKKDNNNINNNIYMRAFEKFWSKYPNRFNRTQTEKNFVKTAKAHGTDAVLRALDNYLAEIERYNTPKEYITRSTNFVGQKAVFMGYLDQCEENSLPVMGDDTDVLEMLKEEGGFSG